MLDGHWHDSKQGVGADKDKDDWGCGHLQVRRIFFARGGDSRRIKYPVPLWPTLQNRYCLYAQTAPD
jgi:hypothetical protein